MGPFTPDLRFSGQTKQGSRHLLLLLAGSITEGKSCKAVSLILFLQYLKHEGVLTFCVVKVEEVVYVLGLCITSNAT
jgi:hypothetical protein